MSSFTLEQTFTKMVNDSIKRGIFDEIIQKMNESSRITFGKLRDNLNAEISDTERLCFCARYIVYFQSQDMQDSILSQPDIMTYNQFVITIYLYTTETTMDENTFESVKEDKWIRLLFSYYAEYYY